jgi:hypothetical protein
MLPEILLKSGLKPYKNGWYILFSNFPPEIEKKNSSNFYKEDEKQDIIYTTGVRDYSIRQYNKNEIIDSYLLQIDKNIEYIQKYKLTKTELIGIGDFHNLLFIPFRFSIMPPGTYAKMIQIMPVYDYEVSGNETPKEMKEMIKKYLLPIDWDRKPSPKTFYKFYNKKLQCRTKGKAYHIDTEDNLYFTLGKFDDNECYLELKNILNEIINITYDATEKIYLINGSKYTKDNLFKYLYNYLRKK